MTITTLEMSEINTNAGTQMRLSKNGETQLNKEAVARYTESIDDLPPVTVIRVERWKKTSSNLLLVDGFHRYEAHLKAGRTQIKADVIDMHVFPQALHYACTANDNHGLPFTQENKQSMILHLIEVLGREAFLKRFKLHKTILMATTGASATTYQKATQDYRDNLEKERNELILKLDSEDKSQREIAEITESSKGTVENVIKAAAQNTHPANSGQTDTQTQAAHHDNHVKDEPLNETIELSTPIADTSPQQHWDTLADQSPNLCKPNMSIKQEAVDSLSKDQKENLKLLMLNLQMLTKYN